MDAMEQARDEIRLAAQALADSWEEINLLYSIGEILGRTVELDDAAGTILGEISDVVGADLGAIYLYDAAAGLLDPIAARGLAPHDAYSIGVDDDLAVAAHVFRESVPRLYAPGERESPREASLRRGAALASPITWTTPGGPVGLGVVTLSAPRGAEGFSAGDLKLVAAIASQIGAAIQITRLVRASVEQEQLEREMQLAHNLQMRLLPSPAALAPEARCAARVEPARSVGGDFYHLFRLSGGRVGVLIGDVSSHGYQAALIMALTMSAMAIHAQRGTDAAATVDALFETLAGELSETEMFLALCYAVIDPAAGEIRWVNAGQPHAFVIGADGVAVRLGATNPPLGLTPVPAAESVRAWDPGGDTLVLFTDGIPDALDPEGRALGERRVLEVVVARRRDAPSRIVDGVFALLEGHMSGVAPSDDQAIVVVRT
ncbi:MAG: SpoIIE family protein phosphatase [Gemmatimonadaceae bacterium]|nr:SpoIIE family protein phosphatase [Gemmatimonadaceae bacterium]